MNLPEDNENEISNNVDGEIIEMLIMKYFSNNNLRDPKILSRPKIERKDVSYI